MKKPGKIRRNRRRIIIVFLCAVMLPSLVQAYLGLRYVRQEQQRQELLVLRGLKSTLAGTASDIEKNVHLNVFKALDSLVIETSLSSTISPFQLYSFLSGQSLLEEVFVIDHKGHLLYPRTFLTQKETNVAQPALTAFTRQQLISGEENEARGKYNEAIEKYSMGLDESRITREKMAFFVRIARCLFKTGDLVGAEKTYRQILEEDNNQFYGEEISYQLIATFQIVHILDQNNRQKDAFDMLARQYANMLLAFQRFNERRFMYYLANLYEELQLRKQYAGPGSNELLDSIIQAEKVFMQEPARAKFLEANIIPSIEIALVTQSEPNTLRYTSIDHAADNPIYIAFMDLGYQARGNRIIGASLNDASLVSMVEKSLAGTDTTEGLQVVLRDEKDEQIEASVQDVRFIAEESLSLLDGTMDRYKLILLSKHGISLKDFTFKGVIPYYAIVLVIILVIAMGVIVIFQDISREQELTRMKSEFISNVTHEIKTPIATIRSLAENVSEGWVSSIDKQQDYFGLIARESERLGHLVENTLDFSRIETGSKRYIMDPGSLQEVIIKTVERFRLLSEGQGVKINAEINDNLPAVFMDKVAMGQAILNLLDNAAKYSPEEKVISLVADTEGDTVKIVVADKGMGISRKDISRVFDKFYRSEASSNGRITGSGIGLTLVKDIVESHGGTVTVDSEINNGSTFTIRIPINSDKRNGKHIID
ncbi:MAG: hypothetical protein GQ544_08600 [Candidatus Aminicenantes bacterium]|nr:hypothetical protein [Candidatus Aminicenantes bacterium]